MAVATSDWGVTTTGFYCPTYDEVLTAKINTAKELFGDDICTDSNTALGKFLRIEAKYDNRLFEELEAVYYSISPVTATGAALDRAVSFARITRNMGTAAVYKLKIYSNTKGYTLKKGTLVKSDAGVVFYLASDVTTDVVWNTTTAETSDGDDGEIGALATATGYYGTVNVQCVDAGSGGNVASITGLVETDSNITGIETVGQVTVGADTETDAELRDRYNAVVDGLGSNTKSAVASQILRVSGVKGVKIIDNNNLPQYVFTQETITNADGDEVTSTNSTDRNAIEISGDFTVPSRSYAIIVYAESASDDDIAEAIFKSAPLGVPQAYSDNDTYGRVITVQDAAGEGHKTAFTYAAEKTVTVEAKIKITASTASYETISEQIKEYIDGLGIGDTLIFGKLYERVYSVSGVTEVTSLRVGIPATTDDSTTDGEDSSDPTTYYTENIEAADDEIIRAGVMTLTITEA